MFTMQDVEAAKQRCEDALENRSGVATKDFVLSQVRDEASLTAATQYLITLQAEQDAIAAETARPFGPTARLKAKKNFRRELNKPSKA